jgi:hypothetical protein
MKKLFLLPLFFILTFSFHSVAQLPPTDSSWELKFSDEFDSYDSTVIDTSKWNTCFPWGQSGGPEVYNCYDSAGMTFCDTMIGVNYFEQWQDTAAFTSHSLVVDTNGNGFLKIIARKQNHKTLVTNYYSCGDIFCTDTTCRTVDSVRYYCIGRDSALFNYTTAMLYSKNKFKYGYFELKFKIPPAPTPPATNSGYTIDWWLWAGESNGHSSEIDMYEIRGQDSTYTNNVHYYSDSTDQDQAGITYFHSPHLNSSWHVSALEWAPDKIDFYLDGNKIRSYPFKPDSMIPMPMIIDLDANATNFHDGIDTVQTVFPYEIDIDYVRVYQLSPACSTSKNVCVYTPATYDSIYQSLSFGGVCTPTITSSSNVTFRATEYILLDQGFTIDSTSQMLLDIVPCQDDQHCGLRTIQPAIVIEPPPPSFLKRKFYHYLN